MKLKMCLLLLVLSLSALGQSAMPGEVTGTAVPDSVAYRMVFLSLSLSDNPVSQDFEAQQAKINNIGLSVSDASVVVAGLNGFRQNYGSIYIQHKAKTIAPGTTARGLRDGLVQGRIAILQRDLSPDGWSRFSAFVLAQKSRIHTVPEVN